MFAALKIERIGSARLGHQPAWVKQATGIVKGKLIEEFVDGAFDYSEANSVGSRGVHVYYLLEGGPIYHVSSPCTWKRVDQYFCRVEDGEIIRMNFKEVVQRLYRPRRLVDIDTGELING